MRPNPLQGIEYAGLPFGPTNCFGWTAQEDRTIDANATKIKLCILVFMFHHFSSRLLFVSIAAPDDMPIKNPVHAASGHLLAAIGVVFDQNQE